MHHSVIVRGFCFGVSGESSHHIMGVSSVRISHVKVYAFFKQECKIFCRNYSDSVLDYYLIECYGTSFLGLCQRRQKAGKLTDELRNSRPFVAFISHITGTCTARDLERVKKEAEWKKR